MSNQYPTNVKAAAKKHWYAAEALYTNQAAGNNNKAVAGYLYGLAGECGLKQLMWACGHRPDEDGKCKDHPFYAHFPAIKKGLSALLATRMDSKLNTILSRSGLMQNWDTQMRYSAPGAIADRDVARWKEDAQFILKKMEEL